MLAVLQDPTAQDAAAAEPEEPPARTEQAVCPQPVRLPKRALPPPMLGVFDDPAQLAVRERNEACGAPLHGQPRASC